jgi:hypothetical protein
LIIEFATAQSVVTNQSFGPFAGGGDQLYCDTILEIPALKQWLAIENKEEKKAAPWTNDMNEQAHRYYFDEYLKHFQLPGFRDAMACIPFNYVWDVCIVVLVLHLDYF